MFGDSDSPLLKKSIRWIAHEDDDDYYFYPKGVIYQHAMPPNIRNLIYTPAHTTKY